MTTVGYGDISASGGEWFDYVGNMFFIIYGLVFAFLPISDLIGGAMESTEKKILDILDDDPNDDFEVRWCGWVVPGGGQCAVGVGAPSRT